ATISGRSHCFSIVLYNDQPRSTATIRCSSHRSGFAGTAEPTAPALRSRWIQFGPLAEDGERQVAAATRSREWAKPGCRRIAKFLASRATATPSREHTDERVTQRRGVAIAAPPDQSRARRARRARVFALGHRLRRLSRPPGQDRGGQH